MAGGIVDKMVRFRLNPKLNSKLTRMLGSSLS